MRDRGIAVGKLLLLLGSIWLVVTAFVRLTASHSPAVEPPKSHFPLGDTLPYVEVKTPDGRRMSLRERLGGKATLLYVFGTRECAGCSNLPLEFEIVQREDPTISALLVASGAPADSFASFFQTTKLGKSAVIDEQRALLHRLRVTSEPMVLLVDASGRILFVDIRSAAQAAQYPMGHILHDFLALSGRRTESAVSQTK